MNNPGELRPTLVYARNLDAGVRNRLAAFLNTLYSQDSAEVVLREILKESEAPPAEPIPPGIAFHVETALTQARMARRELSIAYGAYDFGPQGSEIIESSLSRQASVIEHLEEIQAKLRK